MQEKEYEVRVEIGVGPDSFEVVEPVTAFSSKEAMDIAEQYIRNNIRVTAIAADCTCGGDDD